MWCKQEDVVAQEDVKLYRNGQLVTNERAFVLTSFYQSPDQGQTAQHVFDQAPHLSLPPPDSPSSITLSFKPKPTAHGSFYLGFTLVDTQTASLSPEVAALVQPGPNTTQYIFVRIVQVNSPPHFVMSSNVTLPSVAPNYAETLPEIQEGVPVHLGEVMTQVTTGAADEDLVQTLLLTVTHTSGMLGAGPRCEQLFVKAPLISFAGYPAVNASITLFLRAFAAGTCRLEITASDLQSPPLLYTDVVTIHVQAVNRAPTFDVVSHHILVVESSGAHSKAGVVSNISSGEGGASFVQQSVVFSVATLASPPQLFEINPSISSSGVLTFTLAQNAWGWAWLTVRAHDDAGTLFNGNDTSSEARLELQVLPRPRLESVYPTWWMATEIPAQNLTLTIRGAYLNDVLTTPHLHTPSSPALPQLPLAAVPDVATPEMLALSLPGVYIIVGGQACLRSVVISDSELECQGVAGFAVEATVNVRVLQQVGTGPIVLREGTLGSARQLQRITLLIGGSTLDGLGFVATASSSTSSMVRQWKVTTDRAVRSLQATAASVSVCYSVLQCVAVCCSVLQCVAVCCSVVTTDRAVQRLQATATSVSRCAYNTTNHT